MSILDDAIREHLELKRAHGADAAELKKLEDEAFGPPARPEEADPLAEAPTEFLATEGAEAQAEPSGRRVPNIADLQEAPEPPKEEPQGEEEPQGGDREAIAEQPTEHFDVEAEMESSAEATGPSDEELVDAEMSEPRLAPVDPLAGVDAAPPEPQIAEPEPPEEPAAEEEEEDDFFSEQRLSDELSQALDAPIEEEHADAEDEDEEEEPAPATSEADDVLEDTPEFLEDAPEDDDLWFEQRPPKDFDFDD